jgi:hypothetical protein
MAPPGYCLMTGAPVMLSLAGSPAAKGSDGLVTVRAAAVPLNALRPEISSVNASRSSKSTRASKTDP